MPYLEYILAVDLEKYQELRKKADKAKADVNRAEGVLEEQMKKLKDDFSCETVEGAEMLLETLRLQEADADAKYNELLTAFEQQWGDLK